MTSLTGMFVENLEERSFLAWMRESGNMFTGDEYHTRLGIWITNKKRTHEHNAANFGFTLSLNRLSHLTTAEYKALLGHKSRNGHNKTLIISRTNGNTIDWRSIGVVNPVQDQGRCGSCWAFSAIQAQESQYALTYGKLQKLSEQNLLDCVIPQCGCEGGRADSCYDYVIHKQKGQFMLLSDYPYKAVQESCKFNPLKGISLILGYFNIEEGSEYDLETKVAMLGPASIAIDASNWSFQLYSSGIYDEKLCSPHILNHAVGCVGYGTDGAKNFWIVRNSWGVSWGENGYIRMIKDKDNRCGVATEAIIPKVKYTS